MNNLLFQYDLNPATWVYLSSLMIIGVYFKFGRFWSLRNLDLVLLIALAPGVLMVEHHRLLAIQNQAAVTQAGYTWLFTVSFFLLIRLLMDPAMVRRPLLEPNLSTGGLTFMGVALLVFLMTNVATREVPPQNLEGPRQLDWMLHQDEPPIEDAWAHYGPGYPLLHLVARVPSALLIPSSDDLPAEQRRLMLHRATARTMVILSQLAIVIGMVMLAYQHFDNIRTGVATASLYLMLPYSAHVASRVDHVLPAALIVWAVVAYRRPQISGILLGLAIGAVYYPVFLLPLWISFYWPKGVVRFLAGLLGVLLLQALSLVLVSSSLETYLGQLAQTLTWLRLSGENVGGFWQFSGAAYRVTVMAAFLALSTAFALWPVQKNLGTLLSCTAALMLGTQFWHAGEGGLFLAWYMPLTLLTIFRPNLEDRGALSILGDSWLPRRWADWRRISGFRRAA